MSGSSEKAGRTEIWQESGVAATADVRIGFDKSLEKVLKKVCLFACLR